ncbi:uncharacterized protein LACBIDRAFT_306541 [Laccaria bicolor S238N-H82]|uniref:Predicted protein n=1 Tax=Laccaria bicolor (strain S238N-H82 / ATCC MYA-4686) TaxID=486041 RepID=B0DN98_LACBS|nr:uncharacterized protein LACBIDRAFT_306541 [Laccaria bicolor S238N-H82]EDR03901.1 predicted protein [Laccaria bicolor S238N-H82]|eukprot:XP_001885469.1 predicted protein [Laccaria bicolor S238N-H82]
MHHPAKIWRNALQLLVFTTYHSLSTRPPHIQWPPSSNTDLGTAISPPSPPPHDDGEHGQRRCSDTSSC